MNIILFQVFKIEYINWGLIYADDNKLSNFK